MWKNKAKKKGGRGKCIEEEGQVKSTWELVIKNNTWEEYTRTSYLLWCTSRDKQGLFGQKRSSQFELLQALQLAKQMFHNHSPELLCKKSPAKISTAHFSAMTWRKPAHLDMPQMFYFLFFAVSVLVGMPVTQTCWRLMLSCQFFVVVLKSPIVLM